MIHLFSKCYLALDNKIDIHRDRYVISKENGNDAWDKIKDIQRGTLYGYQESIEANSVSSVLSSIYFTIKNKEDKFIYYVDEESFPKFLAGWYKFLLPNLNEKEASNLYRAIVLYHNVYHRFVFQEQNSVKELVLSSDPTGFINEYKSLKDVKYADHEKYFRELILPNASFEFKIASFLSDGSMAEDLSRSAQVLLRKEVEGALIEAREIFYSLFLRPDFSSKIGLNKTYNLSNAFDVHKDNSKYTNLLFNDRIWNTSSLSLASSSGATVNLESVTESDGQEFVDFAHDLGFLEMYDSGSVIQDGMYLIEYLDNIKNGFTSEELKEFIVQEYQKMNSNSVFNTPSLPTVNSYLLDYILNNMNDEEVLEKYSLV